MRERDMRHGLAALVIVVVTLNLAIFVVRLIA
jgi:hypothetical protein